MPSDNPVDWTAINQLVKPEHQYLDAVAPPLDAVRMAWPFKTEEELQVLSKWFRKEKRTQYQKIIKTHMDKYGKAFL